MPPQERLLNSDENGNTFSEYLLGENILVAPVLVEGKVSRDIYLPVGEWVDQNGKPYTGPIWLKDYPAELSVLPYFIKSGSGERIFNINLIIITFLVISWNIIKQ